MFVFFLRSLSFGGLHFVSETFTSPLRGCTRSMRRLFCCRRYFVKAGKLVGNLLRRWLSTPGVCGSFPGTILLLLLLLYARTVVTERLICARYSRRNTLLWEENRRVSVVFPVRRRGDWLSFKFPRVSPSGPCRLYSRDSADHAFFQVRMDRYICRLVATAESFMFHLRDIEGKMIYIRTLFCLMCPFFRDI